MADYYYVGSGTPDNWSDDVWAASSGGSPLTSDYPDDNADKAIFDSNGNGDVLLDASLAIGELSQSGNTGDLDLATYTLTVDDAGAHNGDVTLDGTIDFGTGAIDCDGSVVGTAIDGRAGTGKLIMRGSGATLAWSTHGARDLPHLEVASGASVTQSGDIDISHIDVDGTLTVNGTPGDCDVVSVGSGATIDGSGTLTTTNVDQQDGTLSVDVVLGNYGIGLANGAVFSGDLKVLSSSNRTATFPASFTVKGKFSFYAQDVGETYTLDFATNDTSPTFEGDVGIQDTGSGSVSWTKGTGTITFSGASDQDLDFNGLTTEEIIVDKSAGLVTFTDDVDPDYFEANADTAGEYTIALGGKTITSGGKVEIVGGTDGAAFEVVAPDCTGSYPQNGTYNGEPAYEIAGGAYWIWYVGGVWFISTGKGTLPSSWYRTGVVEGEYAPSIYTGYVTVSLVSTTCTVAITQTGGFVVGNDGLAAGTVDGDAGAQLDLEGLAFDLQNSSTLVATYCDISFSAVSNGTGDATAVTNSDGGDNTNWSFAGGLSIIIAMHHYKQLMGVN